MGTCQCRRKRKNTDHEVVFGPMKLKQNTMSVLLVFAKEDAQSDGYWWATEKLGYKCCITTNAEGALECFLDKQPDVVIIDNRNSKHFDAEALCRSMRATKASQHTVIVAVTKRLSTDKDEPSILPLIKAGFNKRVVENHNLNACINELLCLEYGEVRTQLQLSAANALFCALDNVSDAVEIASDDREIQYVNHAWERLMGYGSEEVMEKDSMEVTKNDHNKPDLQDSINTQLKKGKYWEGTYYTRRKNGEILPSHCHVSPVIGPTGQISHIISVKTTSDASLIERLKDTDYSIVNGGVYGFPRRRESVTKIHSMTIEAPITKVINIINAAQENSPITVVQALDRVLEILRTSELYSPYLSQQLRADEDPMTTDLVGGIMSQSMRRQLMVSASQDVNSNSSKGSHQPHTYIPTNPATLSQIPDHIKAILNSEPSWDFDIIRLEKATNNRPLVYLGLKTLMRFGVCDFFNINETCLTNWLTVIESNYHSSNTYHNSTHAADVLHATAFFLEQERNKAVLDQSDVVCSLISAIIHDVDHPGRTNAFLINEGNKLAILYNDQAVLESHHSALAFQLSWENDSANIFRGLDNEGYRATRQNIIDMVLATEMRHHFEHLNKFVNSVNKATLKYEDTSSMSGNGSPDSSVVLNQLTTPENRLLIKRMLIKCADVANPCRPLDLCVEWGKRIAEEYFNQTEEEKKRGLPVVMPIFDRKTCSIPKSQISFIDVFINDMFDAWDYYCDVPDLITHLQNNYKYWQQADDNSQDCEEASSPTDGDKT